MAEIYKNLPFSEYQKIEAWRSHDLMTLAQCGFRWANQSSLHETPALLEGRVQHTVFLELDSFNGEFIIEPDLNRRTKVGKEQYAEWAETIGDRTPIKRALYETCMERRAAIEHLVPKPEHDVELTVVFDWLDQKCKSRFDWHDGECVLDLKTCRDASPRGFRRSISTFRYYQQAAFYLTAARAAGLRADRFWFLAQEKAHPFPHQWYTLSGAAIEYGDQQNEQALALGLDIRGGAQAPRAFNIEDDWVEFDADDLF